MIAVSYTHLLTEQIVKELYAQQGTVSQQQAEQIFRTVQANDLPAEKKEKYDRLLDWIEQVPKFGNDDAVVDAFARDVAYT